MSDHEPALLPPQIEPQRRLAIPLGIVAVGLAAAIAAGVFGSAHLNSNSPAHDTASAVTVRGAFASIDAANPMELTRAIETLRLDAEAKRAIREEVMAGRLRLGMLTVWDWKDEDGDEITITSAGFSQAVPLWNKPTTVVIPYRGVGAMIAITGLKDGEGGITAGVSIDGQSTNLQPLYIGETVQVAIP